MLLKYETHRASAAGRWVWERFKLSIDQLIFPRSTEAVASIVMGMLIRRSGLMVINVICSNRKDWSGREDLNLRPPGPEKGIKGSYYTFSIFYSGASTVSFLLDHLILDCL